MLACARCNKELQNAIPDGTNQPQGGLAFTSLGHYGCTVFDPIDGSFLELNICDECLQSLAAKKQVLYGKPAPFGAENEMVVWEITNASIKGDRNVIT